MEFYGYPRIEGPPGVRNHVVVLPTVGCANELANEIASLSTKAFSLLHNHACIRLGKDLKRARKTLIGILSNPNVHSALIVGLGCESITAEELLDRVNIDKSIEMVELKREDTYDRAVEKGKNKLQRMIQEAFKTSRVPCSMSDITIGIKCGGSSALSAISSNSATGKASDLLIEEGGKVIFSETAELIGAEHILAERAENQEVADKLLTCVSGLKEKIKANGIDILGSEPTQGNIQGGLTTIEEKSLGAIIKGGTTSLVDVLNYAEPPEQGEGLYFMNGTTQASQLFLGMFSAGAQIQLFSFGGGLPARLRGLPSYPCGIPVLPVIKVLGSPAEIDESDYFDAYAGGIIDEDKSVEKIGEEILSKIRDVASGERTVTETRDRYSELLQFYTTGLLM